VKLLLAQRGGHNIEHELIFPTHSGYVFHDSRGFESGGEEELEIVQDFVRRKSRESQLTDKLHAIWSVPFWVFTVANLQGLLFRYCISMDNDWPLQDSRRFAEICPDKEGMSECNSATL
jgi:hypothetical protein